MLKELEALKAKIAELQQELADTTENKDDIIKGLQLDKSELSEDVANKD
jgi:hypothetical protein